MKQSKLLLQTYRDAPRDADVISQQLMMRGGMIQKVAAGIYDYLPLALRSIRKFESIVREELERDGCQELLMPTVQPADLWQESSRWQFYGRELLRFKDRKGADFCLGPTHEEMFTLPLGLKSFQASLSTQWGLYAAASILVSLPVVIVFLMLSKFLISGLTLGSVKE